MRALGEGGNEGTRGRGNQDTHEGMRATQGRGNEGTRGRGE